MRSTHRTLIDVLNQEAKPYTEPVTLRNCAKFILLADRIDDNMGCLYLNSSIMPKMVRGLGQHLKDKLEDLHIDVNVSAPVKTWNLVIDFPNNDSKRHWGYITETLLGLPTHIIRDVSAPAFAMELITPYDNKISVSTSMPLKTECLAYDDTEYSAWLNLMRTEQPCSEEAISYGFEYDIKDSLDEETIESLLKSLRSP